MTEEQLHELREALSILSSKSAVLEEREALRRMGDWKTSDEIRKKLLDMGIEISDTAHGVTWRLK